MVTKSQHRDIEGGNWTLTIYDKEESMKEFLKISSIKARDLSEAWFLCLREVLRNGYVYTIDKGSSQGQRRKGLDFIVLEITHPGLRPLSPDVPAGAPAPASAEAIEEYMKYLLTSERNSKQEYTYGEDLEEPIFKVIEMYKKEGFGTNQACLSIGGANSILLKDPQCLRIIDTRIRYGKLHFVIYFRSWDLYGGLPMNLGGLQLLKEFMAEEIGVEDGGMIAISKGLHLYENSWKAAEACARLPKRDG